MAIGFDRVTFDPQIMSGHACVRGMRVTVSLVLYLVANGMSFTATHRGSIRTSTRKTLLMA